MDSSLTLVLITLACTSSKALSKEVLTTLPVLTCYTGVICRPESGNNYQADCYVFHSFKSYNVSYNFKGGERNVLPKRCNEDTFT